ncbi:MAG: preprotein translocase subunit SecG [Panacagrimonas sp.]
MYTVLVVVQVVVAVALIGLVLIQHGKGADAGAAFGSGASGTVFGARGAANFLTRSTAWLAAAFFICSLALAYMVANRTTSSRSIVDTIEAAPQAQVPAAVAPAASIDDAPVAVEPAAPQAADETPKAPE